SKLPVRQCTEIIPSHHHDFHTKKAKIPAQTLFCTPGYLSEKSIYYILVKNQGQIPSFFYSTLNKKTPVPYLMTNDYT
ncbi:hypothetical protein VZ148_21735, partial [Enterobacter hormaechei]|uniref:hypothetical protein n=1 Tax=Enterobacter hormaechei TaxID=158836 RepID=UPI002E2DF9CA